MEKNKAGKDMMGMMGVESNMMGTESNRGRVAGDEVREGMRRATGAFWVEREVT